MSVFRYSKDLEEIGRLRAQLFQCQKDFAKMSELNEHHKAQFLRVNLEATRLQKVNEELRGLVKEADYLFDRWHAHGPFINDWRDRAKKALEE